ncbi:ferric reductase-like transmembrane domain-containing protein [Halotalea alkalilenta]|uniref:ferric reductase-like transmembrane domain-containing protein n=1 Tax=Halotalea alkalilenta TaxID=376489 RepID=UPI001CBE5F61|nr:ferric reductase-like transmembrane domain-containing protein [Halotalea alkalilenta]
MSRPGSQLRHPRLLLGFRIVVFALAIAWPLGWAWRVAQGAAGPDPGRYLLLEFGIGALTLLLLVLALTPLAKLTGWPGFGLVRRQLGVWAFVYAFAHFACYLLFIIGLEPALLLADFSRRPYIIVGAAALLLLGVLAATSPQAMVRRLKKRWKPLHRLVYLALALVLLHFFWIVRADLGEWGRYALIALGLMLLRWPPLARRLGGWRRASGARTEINRRR